MDFLWCLAYVSKKFIPKSYPEFRHPSISILLNIGIVQLGCCRTAILMQSSEKSLLSSKKCSLGLMEAALVGHQSSERYEQDFLSHLCSRLKWNQFFFFLLAVQIEFK